MERPTLSVHAPILRVVRLRVVFWGRSSRKLGWIETMRAPMLRIVKLGQRRDGQASPCPG